MANTTLNKEAFNAEGFLLNPEAWSEQLAAELAAGEGIQLTPRHWDVIRYMRKDFVETGKSPTIRRITKFAGVDTKELYALFPGGPGKKAAKIAGVPKPVGCI
ncbi:MAG: TusE/DsrC/DsvC family sulfur relay protein [Spirochaetes bacterium]|nr:TusE/DsrC/DsvC family sulfur relay protein [Spirochaetota bacterium]